MCEGRAAQTWSLSCVNCTILNIIYVMMNAGRLAGEVLMLSFGVLKAYQGIDEIESGTSDDDSHSQVNYLRKTECIRNRLNSRDRSG